jgi:hypothetical protein
MVCNNPKTICDNHIRFEGVSSITEDLLLNILESNFKAFFDWSFLNISAWFNAEIGEYTIESNSYSPAKLNLLTDEVYQDGQLWQGMRKDWVWETGCFVESGVYSPIEISGVYVDGSFMPYPGGGYKINYPEGQVLFDSAISVASDVKVNYSYRNIQVYRASDSPWFSTIQYNSFNPEAIQIEQTLNGDWTINGIHRVQLPAIVIDPISRSRSRPLNLGNNDLIMEQDIGFYVLAENKNDRNKLLDILRLQQGITIQLYDTSQIAEDGKSPLDHDGDINPTGIMYPQMVQDYPWRTCLLKTVGLYEVESISPNFHQGLARATLEIIS